MITLLSLGMMFVIGALVQLGLGVYLSYLREDRELPRFVNSAVMFLSQGLGALIVYALH